MSGAPKLRSRHRSFGGWTEFYSHLSAANRCEMRFAVYRPPAAERGPVPALYYLAGLTCTEETFMIKAGAQALAAELGLLLVAPDTSPRGLGLPGEDADWDFGSGAGFYLDATEAPWAAHYRMESYVTGELVRIVEANFPAARDRRGIFGHSMGGHGALTLALRHPGLYASASAFAPIAAPMLCPWGRKAFSGYLGPGQAAWAGHDASRLVRNSTARLPMLVDQGEQDQFLAAQLMPQELERAAAEAGYPLTLRRHAGYDHSYYFIASFMAEHLGHHAAALNP